MTSAKGRKVSEPAVGASSSRRTTRTAPSSGSAAHSTNPAQEKKASATLHVPPERKSRNSTGSQASQATGAQAEQHSQEAAKSPTGASTRKHGLAARANKRPTMSDGKVERVVWKPSDGNGDPSHAFIDDYSLRSSGHPTWKLYTGGSVCKKATEVTTPHFVYLDDKAALEVIRSNHWSAEQKYNFWPFDFTRKGQLRVNRPHRGRPAYESDGKSFCSILRDEDKRYWFHGNLPAPRRDAAHVADNAAEKSLTDEKDKAAISAGAPASKKEIAEEDETLKGKSTTEQHPSTKRSSASTNASAARQSPQPSTLAIQPSTVVEQPPIADQTSTAAVENQGESLMQPRLLQQPSEATAERSEHFQPEQSQISSLEKCRSPITKPAEKDRTAVVTNKAGVVDSATDLTSTSAPQGPMNSLTPPVSAPHGPLPRPLVPSPVDRTAHGQVKLQQGQPIGAVLPTPTPNTLAPSSPPGNLQPTKRSASPACASPASPTPALKRQRRPIALYKIPTANQPCDAELLQLRDRLRDSNQREHQKELELEQLRSQHALRHRAATESSARLDASEKRSQAFRAVAVRLYARTVDQTELLAERHAALVRVVGDAAILTAAAERIAADAMAQLGSIESMHADLNVTMDACEKMMCEAGIRAELDTFVDEAMRLET